LHFSGGHTCALKPNVELSGAKRQAAQRQE
jgi:hypothetical protein